MQTLQPKSSPTETAETKPKLAADIKSNVKKDLVLDAEKKLAKNQHTPTSSFNDSIQTKLKEEVIIKDNQPMETKSNDLNENNNKATYKVEKMEDDMSIEPDIDENSSSTDMDTFKESFLQGSSAEEAFDKLKKEEQESMLNNVDMETEDTVVKENISKIIDNFENEDKSNLDEEDLFDLPESSSDMTTGISTQAVDNETSSELTEQKENLNSNEMEPVETMPAVKLQKTAKESAASKISGPKLLYEIQSQDGFTYKSTSITEIWEKLFEAVQIARKAHGLSPLPVGPLADMCGYQMMGLKTNALKYLLEQLPGVERCSNYSPVYHKRAESTISQASSSGYWSDSDEIKENANGTARCERYKGRSEYDMFGWLASRHRKQPIQISVPQSCTETENLVRRGTGSNLPMAMRYRTLKETYKDAVGVYRSHIHGRGLFCNRDIEAGNFLF